MGRAAGVNTTALAEWLPGLEATAVNAMNKRMKDQGDG
jgi:D-alanyl-D-alanine carboxypeptidase